MIRQTDQSSDYLSFITTIHKSRTGAQTAHLCANRASELDSGINRMTTFFFAIHAASLLVHHGTDRDVYACVAKGVVPAD